LRNRQNIQIGKTGPVRYNQHSFLSPPRKQFADLGIALQDMDGEIRDYIVGRNYECSGAFAEMLSNNVAKEQPHGGDFRHV